MKKPRDPSLLQSTGYRHRQTLGTNGQKLTIIYNHYLKNLREELLEETVTSIINHINEILYITAEIEGIPTQIMIDTGANAVSYTHLDVYKRQLVRLKLGK